MVVDMSFTKKVKTGNCKNLIITYTFGVFNLCQHFEISYSRNANKHITTGVYITINE